MSVKQLMICTFSISLTFGFCFADEINIITETATYCKHDKLELQLNIAFIDDGNTHPALVFIPGSGFGYYTGYSFDRNQFNYSIREAASKGYVAVTVDYRPISIKDGNIVRYPYPSQLIDVRSSVRWLRANSKKYSIDVDNIGAIGWSSGGNLALLLGMFDDEKLSIEEDNIEYSSRVNAIVSMCGPVDLVSKYNDAKDMTSKSILLQYLGGTPDEIQNKYLEASPINHINENTPPILLIYGDADTQVPIRQAIAFKKKLEENKRTVEIYIYEKGGHTNYFYDKNIFPFFDRYLKRK